MRGRGRERESERERERDRQREREMGGKLSLGGTDHTARVHATEWASLIGLLICVKW